MASSIQPRKQRKALATTPMHARRKQVASHLSEELLVKYNRRTMPVITGDVVTIMRGGNRGHSGKVVSIDTKKRRVTIEGVTHKKADGTDVALPVDPSNLLITKLNLEDARRRTKLGETAEAAPAKKAAAKPAESKTESKEASE